MNQTDMDRYFWRTGQTWSGDCRSLRRLHGLRPKLTTRAIILLFVAALLTAIAAMTSFIVR